MEQAEAEKLGDRMREDLERLGKEFQAECDEYTKTPRTMEEMVDFMAKHRVIQQQKVAAIFDKYYDRDNDRAK